MAEKIVVTPDQAKVLGLLAAEGRQPTEIMLEDHGGMRYLGVRDDEGKVHRAFFDGPGTNGYQSLVGASAFVFENAHLTAGDRLTIQCSSQLTFNVSGEHEPMDERAIPGWNAIGALKAHVAQRQASLFLKGRDYRDLSKTFAQRKAEHAQELVSLANA
jgi:hypothetical protein